MNTGVGWVDESAAVQAQPGDVVVLKGHSWPGCLG
jgi:Lhr-like helicase